LIATAAIRKAQENYNKKFKEYVKTASKEASADVAQFLCQKIAAGAASPGTNTQADLDVVRPWDLVYNVSSGIGMEALIAGGGVRTSHSANATSSFDGKVSNSGMAASAVADVALTAATAVVGGGSVLLGSAIAAMSGASFKTNIPGGTMETTALFNREKRICNITRVSKTRACKQKARVKVLFVNVDGGMECGEEKTTTEKEAIEM
jgi:hypothetical protein